MRCAAVFALLLRLAARRTVTATEKVTDGVMLDLSEYVYSTVCQQVGVFKMVGDKGIPEVDLSEFKDDRMGLYSGLFYNEKTNEYALAFRGTDDAKDWITNIAQGAVGGGEQYQRLGAVRELKELSAYVKSQGGSLIATGHSLGGGLATAASSTGFIDRAVVFNPAGLHLLTASKLDGSIEKAARVTKAYVSDIDVLPCSRDNCISFHINKGRGCVC